jgi:hypothetical protein
LFVAAELQEVEETAHSIRIEHSSLNEWWEPFTLGVGPPEVMSPGSIPRDKRGCANAVATNFLRHHFS